MGFYRGPKIVTDGLILHLDAANYKSFRGEPTTNVVTNTNLDTGWSKGYQTNIVFNEIEPPEGINSPVVGFDRGNTSGYWYSYGDYAPKVPNTVYTVSLYVKTLDSNFTIAFYTADNSETGRVWGSYIAVPANGKWNRIVWPSFTNPSNSQSNSLSFNFTYSGSIGSPSTRTWFCAPQMEAKSYATPFVNGTRGTTVATGGGWADRSGNSNNGTLVNGVTFNSDNKGVLVLDGTNDHISISNVVSITGPYTILIWIKPNVALASGGSGANKPTGSNRKTPLVGPGPVWNPGIWVTSDYIRSHAKTQYIDSAINWTTTSWAMIGMTYDGTNCQNIFNGSILPVAFTTGYSPSDPNTLLIGAETTVGNSQNWNGNFGIISIYNRVLTSNEILQNYNATKSRYGL